MAVLIFIAHYTIKQAVQYIFSASAFKLFIIKILLENTSVSILFFNI